ncbi:MAG: winged helix DNA-binding protein [Sphingobium sp.]|nr:winged helix DNA-binding protein [Sphingobium sp.]
MWMHLERKMDHGWAIASNDLPPMPHDPSRLIIIGSPEHAHQAERWVALTGVAMSGHCPVEAVSPRWSPPEGCKIVMAFLDDHDATTTQHEALMRFDRLAAAGDIHLIVIAMAERLDMAFAALSSSSAQLLCQPETWDLASAVTTAMIAARRPIALNDIGTESEPSRIDRLSEEVSRLARALAAIAPLHMEERHDPFRVGRMADRTSDYVGEDALSPAASKRGANKQPTAADMRSLLRARRLRDRHFPGDLFADPAWDMLLDLMAARLSGERVSVSSLCIAAAVPPTTALRWIRNLTAQGLFEREADRDDARRVFIRLSDDGAKAMEQWYAAAHGQLA